MEADALEELIGLGIRRRAQLEVDAHPNGVAVDGAKLDIRARHAKREAAIGADGVLDLLGADERGRHQPLASEGAERLGGLLGADLLLRQALEDAAPLAGLDLVLLGVCVRVRFESLVEAFAEVGVGLVAGLTAESERADERVDPAAHGRVADAQLALHLLEVASRAEEALEQAHLLAIQPSRSGRRRTRPPGRCRSFGNGGG